jgi:hypothetical protein
MMHHGCQLFLKVIHGICEHWFELVFNPQQIGRILKKTEKCVLRHRPYQLFKIRPACIVPAPYMTWVDHLEGEQIVIDDWESQLSLSGLQFQSLHVFLRCA